jgi:hypothetical protein
MDDGIGDVEEHPSIKAVSNSSFNYSVKFKLDGSDKTARIVNKLPLSRILPFVESFNNVIAANRSDDLPFDIKILCFVSKNVGISRHEIFSLKNA